MSPVSAGQIGASSRRKLWTPAQLGSTVIAWYDASDASTITLVSGVVSQWNDKSGNAKHLSQATSTLRPSVLSSALNGRDMLRFQNDRLATSSNIFASSSVTVMHAFMVAAVPESGRVNYMTQVSFHGNNAATRMAAPASVKGVSEHYWIHSDSNGYITIGSQSGSEFVRYLYTVSKGTSLATARLFTTTGVSTNSGTDGTSTTSTLQVGGNSADASGYDQRIGELVVCNAEQTNANRDRVEGYLAWKWGLNDLLDSGHTYKNAAP